MFLTDYAHLMFALLQLRVGELYAAHGFELAVCAMSRKKAIQICSTMKVKKKGYNQTNFKICINLSI
jgi:hypothetical protein